MPTILDMPPEKLLGKRFEIDAMLAGEMDGRIEVFEPPQPFETYALGGDCAYGIEGRDYDAVHIARRTHDGKAVQVLEMHGHWGERLDRLVYAAAMIYNSAFVVLERQVGFSILRRLFSEYAYRHLYYERDHVKKGRPTKDALGHPRTGDDMTLRDLRRAVIDGSYTIRSKTTLEQMMRLQWHSRREDSNPDDRDRDDALKVKLPGGGSPDLVMAACYAWMGVREVMRFDPPKPKYAPGTLGHALGHNEWEGRNSDGPPRGVIGTFART